MFDPLTKKQKQVLDFVSEFIKKNKYSPSLDEIRSGLNLKAVSTVHEHINKLKEKGYLIKEINQARGVEIRSESDSVADVTRIPFMGSIKKSQLILSNKTDYFLCDSYISNKKIHLVAIKVEDSSLQKDGFLKNDIIVIEKGSRSDGLCIVSTNSSNVVVIRKVVEDKFSIKLISSNPEFKDRVYKKVKVIGSLVSLIRPFSS